MEKITSEKECISVAQAAQVTNNSCHVMRLSIASASLNRHNLNTCKKCSILNNQLLTEEGRLREFDVTVACLNVKANHQGVELVGWTANDHELSR